MPNGGCGHARDMGDDTHQIHTQHVDAPPVPLAKLLEGEQNLTAPLGRAAASLMRAMREYERAHQKSHPLMTGAMRGV